MQIVWRSPQPIRRRHRWDARLVAYVVAAPNASPAAQDLRHYLQERLPDYMVPAAFVQMAGLPLTHNQKIDRLALPEPDGRPDAGSVAAPRDELERELVKIWEGELKVHPVGIDENFFELGGNSLIAVQLFNQIERALGERLPLPTLFRAPTIAQLAEVLRGTEVPA